VYLDIGQEIYDSMTCEEKADGAKSVEVPPGYALRRTVAEASDQCAIYFTEIRDSLRNILLDIEKHSEQQALVHSASFWREFITKSVSVPMAEPRVWDFKETLSMWSAKDNAKIQAKLDFAQDVAALANARGGVLVVGVTDKQRRVVGVPTGKALENRLQFAKQVIADHLEYQRELTTFKQITINCEGVSKICLVIVVAQACQAVGVNDGQGNFTYPVRLETGKQRTTLFDLLQKKAHIKSDNIDFINELLQFIRDH
jgi:hypothetical protein